jgi:hypothetical protein
MCPTYRPRKCARRLACFGAPARFYSGGFVPVSLVTVPITTDQADIEKIERFFKRMATGIKKMFNALGVREAWTLRRWPTLKDSIT